MWWSLIIGLALAVVSYLLTPKPETPAAPQEKMDNPTASAGTPIPVIFGTLTLKNPNVLWYGDKSTEQYEINP